MRCCGRVRCTLATNQREKYRKTRAFEVCPAHHMPLDEESSRLPNDAVSVNRDTAATGTYSK